MTAALRPMNLGEILDCTFQIYKSKFLIFVGIAALPALVTMSVELTSYLLWGTYPDGSLNLAFGVTTAELSSLLAFYHFSLFFQLLALPGFAYVVSLSHPPGEMMPTLRSALQASILRRRGRLALSAIVFLNVLVLPEIVGAALFVGVAFLLSEVLKYGADTLDLVLPPVLVLVFVASWVGIGWMSAVFSLAIPGWTLEELSARAALRRGRNLSKGTCRQILAAWLMPATLGWGIYFAISRALLLLRSSCPAHSIVPLRLPPAYLLFGSCLSPSILELIRLVSEATFSTLIGPIFPIALTLFYYDQRIRREGYDIEKMMEAAGLNAPPNPSAPAEQSASGHAEVQA